MSTNEWLLTSDFWQFLEPWHRRRYENEIFIASCTDNIYNLENERWLLGDMIDHVAIYWSRVAEGLSAFNVGLVTCMLLSTIAGKHIRFTYNIYIYNVFEYAHIFFCVPLITQWHYKLRVARHKGHWSLHRHFQTRKFHIVNHVFG